MWKTLGLLAGVMVVLGLGIVFFRGKNLTSRLGGATLTPTQAIEGAKVWNQTESEKAARGFVLNSTSFFNQGSSLTLEKSFNLLKCSSCWQFTYSFKNATGRHQMLVSLENGQIVSALTDGTFNELDAAVK